MTKLLISRRYIQRFIDARDSVDLHEQIPREMGDAQEPKTQIGERFASIRFIVDGENEFLELDLPSWPYQLSNFMVVEVRAEDVITEPPASAARRKRS